MSHLSPPPAPPQLQLVVLSFSGTQTIPIDTLTGKPRGNGYVTMSTDAEALDAIHGMNDQEYDDGAFGIMEFFAN